MNPKYPNAPFLQPFEIPYGNNECNVTQEQLQDAFKSLGKMPTKYILTNNRQTEFKQLLNQIIQSAQKQLSLLGGDISAQNDINKDKPSNAFSSVSKGLRWYRPVGDEVKRTAQAFPQTSLQNLPSESNVLGNSPSNTFNGIGAWFNQAVLQNPTNNYNMVWRRTVGLAQDIGANATELPPALRQQLSADLQLAASLIAPYTNEQGAQPAQNSSMRSASVRDLSGLTRMFSDLQALAGQALGNLNPPLVAQFNTVLSRCETLLYQYQQGGTGSYPQTAISGTAPTLMSAMQQPNEMLTSIPPAVSQWAQVNGTTPDIFLKRVKGWMSANEADASALTEHLQQYGLPTSVIAWALRQQ